jgi:peptidoglycan/LPS O-acetylase OafA/YrhL
LTYQPALDGVRAVAVMMVLFFHAGFGWMGGGYVGVADVLRTASQSLDSSKPSENPRLR